MAREHAAKAEAKAKPAAKVSQLPVLAVGPGDLSRLIRELEAVDETLRERTLRKGKGEAKLLKTSQLMDQLVEANKLDLLQAADREQLTAFLTDVQQRAPVLHMRWIRSLCCRAKWPSRASGRPST